VMSVDCLLICFGRFSAKFWHRNHFMILIHKNPSLWSSRQIISDILWAILLKRISEQQNLQCKRNYSRGHHLLEARLLALCLDFTPLVNPSHA
jgi:hypothetical protein